MRLAAQPSLGSAVSPPSSKPGPARLPPQTRPESTGASPRYSPTIKLEAGAIVGELTLARARGPRSRNNASGTASLFALAEADLLFGQPVHLQGSHSVSAASDKESPSSAEDAPASRTEPISRQLRRTTRPCSHARGTAIIIARGCEGTQGAAIITPASRMGCTLRWGCNASGKEIISVASCEGTQGCAKGTPASRPAAIARPLGPQSARCASATRCEGTSGSAKDSFAS